MSAEPCVRRHSFAPVTREDARVLILGSMPGEASLAARQYYAHPQNQFWPIMEALCGLDRTLTYPRRLERLVQNRIALWDVLYSCVRIGSLDASIEQASAVPNDLPGLLRTHQRIVRICCNGAAAYRALQRHFGAELQRDFPQIQSLRLPSSSPAHAGMRLADKLALWRAAMSL
jgi:double-stranded uracil-DNA glycosylase